MHREKSSVDLHSSRVVVIPGLCYTIDLQVYWSIRDKKTTINLCLLAYLKVTKKAKKRLIQLVNTEWLTPVKYKQKVLVLFVTEWHGSYYLF